MSDASSPAPNALMQQAYEQLQEGRIEEAVEIFSAALAVDPREAKALRGRGLAYTQLKRWSLAASDFDAARTLAPEETDNWVDLGKSLAMQDQAYPALKVFETLLTQHPECVRGHIELGLLQLRLGAIPKARQHLQDALACSPPLQVRREIEAILREQDKLDCKRYYRPDFEALHQHEEQRAAGVAAKVRSWWMRWRKS